jgi:hypothetical protein
MVGDAKVPLLRIVPVEGRDGEMITHVEFILELRPVLFPLDGFNDPFGRGIRPNAFVALTPCKSVPSTRLRYSLRYINCEDTVSLSIRFPMLRRFVH